MVVAIKLGRLRVNSHDRRVVFSERSLGSEDREERLKMSESEGRLLKIRVICPAEWRLYEKMEQPESVLRFI